MPSSLKPLLKHLSLALVLSSTFAATVVVAGAPQADARGGKVTKKPMTITDRIEELSKKIDAGQKANELTLDEADDLRKKITKLNEKIDKWKAKNGGKLSYKDQNAAEKDLNKVSVKLLEKQLAKRTEKPGT
ncbi:MAG: hypothetical protein JSS86_16565 [Cyanobacteria bacterium SZAS LIN-2]|nr:hypothetical protein [Cyanobacteria bacterium SZAS LIN-3]MBS1997939.1 hypothetical protein [Cyanobacteria bacterium SZAS LIN-2]MBS2007036.1 hypothetical protein [Cyanobacteria bacterium SZAS TMP-1]